MLNCCLPGSVFDYTPLLSEEMQPPPIHPDYVTIHKSLETSCENDRQKLEVIHSLDWSVPAALAESIAHRILWIEKENLFYRKEFLSSCKIPSNNGAAMLLQSRNKIRLRKKGDAIEVLDFANEKLTTIFTTLKLNQTQVNEVVELAKAINRIHKKHKTLEMVQERVNPSHLLVRSIMETKV